LCGLINGGDIAGMGNGTRTTHNLTAIWFSNSL